MTIMADNLSFLDITSNIPDRKKMDKVLHNPIFVGEEIETKHWQSGARTGTEKVGTPGTMALFLDAAVNVGHCIFSVFRSSLEPGNLNER